MKKTLLFLFALVFALNASSNQTIIPLGSTWKYLDNGSDQGTAWRQASFDDATWASGAAELGFGDAPTTIINGGPSTARFITTYFRKTVSIADISLFTGYTLNVRRDDGIVVYVNGVEAYRDNMGTGTILFNTYSPLAAPDDGATVQTATLAASLFQNGNNTISVEVHQSGATSSDLTFEMEFIGVVPNSSNEVIYQWSGAVQPTSATVVAKLSNVSSTCKLVVSTSATLTTSPITSAASSATLANNKMAKMAITGLLPNTTYYYGIESDGTLDSSTDDIGKFTTPSDQPFSYLFTVGACSTNSYQQVYSVMKTENPLFHVSTGDFHYGDPNSATDINVHRNPYEVAILSKALSRDFFINIPLTHIWDDHDYCGNDSDGASVGKTNARLSYQEYIPHYPLTAGSGDVPIYQSFKVGRVYYILTDLRSERAGASMMGATQKQWFKDQCIFARNNNLIIAWVTGVSFGGNQLDNWGGFTAERTELSDFFRDNLIENMFIMSGDAHMLAIDNGTNHDFSTGSNNAFDYPVFQAAALNRAGSTKGGTYSEGGTFPNTAANNGQYGVVEVTDLGGSTITIKFTGYRNPELTSTKTQINTYTFTRTLVKVLPLANFSFSLRAIEQGSKVVLSWKTASVDDEVLTIERSKDGVNSQIIKTINSATQSYTDINPVTGWNYYTIKNAKDAIIGSNQIFIRGNTELNLAPNPASDVVKLIVKQVSQQSNSRFIIYNTAMKTVLQGNITLSKGDNTIPVNISTLSAGVYVIHVVINGVELTQKLIKN